MKYEIGDILSVELTLHTRHFFVYIGNHQIIEWGPWDGISWVGGKGHIFRKELFKDQWLNHNGDLKEITLEKRTGASLAFIEERIQKITKGIDYHLAHRNCEHFAYYITGHIGYSNQSRSHFFTDHNPFTNEPMIKTLSELKNELLRSKYCGPVALTREDFKDAVFVNELNDGYYVYHLSHPLGGQHLYVTSIPKVQDFEESYDGMVLTYYGAFFGRGEIFSIVQQLRGC